MNYMPALKLFAQFYVQTWDGIDFSVSCDMVFLTYSESGFANCINMMYILYLTLCEPGFRPTQPVNFSYLTVCK